MTSAPESTHRLRVLNLESRLRELDLAAGPTFPCPYRPGFEAVSPALQLSEMPAGLYHAFLDLNFRRMGSIVYRPACPTCRSCRQLRVPVASFVPNRAQKRSLNANRDLTVEVGRPRATEEKARLYARYLRRRHDTTMDGSWKEMVAFLYTTCVETREVTFRLGRRLAAVGVMDVEPRALSAVYCFYDPEFRRRSLGTFNILWLIQEARRKSVPYVYLGYYVAESPTMRYKANFKPCEVWSDGEWRSP